MLSNNLSDKRSLVNFDEQGQNFFICLKNNSIVHYFLTYEDASLSPLINTPFNKSLIKKGDAYLGSTFTIPRERGNWIVPSSISYIIDYYKNLNSVKKLFVLVNKETPGAIEFYERLGFNRVNNAAPKNFFYFFRSGK